MNLKNTELILAGEVKSIERAGRWLAFVFDSKSKNGPVSKLILRDSAATQAGRDVAVGDRVLANSDIFKLEDGVLKLFVESVSKIPNED